MKNEIAKSFLSLKTAIKKHSPEILTGIGIAGMITTTVMAVITTPKAMIFLEKNKGEEQTKKLAPTEVIKTTWTCYIPAAITGSISVACLIGASSVSARRNAALATAYTLSADALKDYRAKVVETIGEKKEQSVRDAVAKEKIEKNPVTKGDVVITNHGGTLCYDALSGRYFKSDIETIRKAVNNLNCRMRYEMYISLNEFYSELDLAETKLGDILGWNIDDGYIEPSFSSQLSEDGTPCLVVDYLCAPKYDYGKLS